MKNYNIIFRNQTVKKASGNTLIEAFESLNDDKSQLIPVSDPFFADVCIELVGGKRESKKYYSLQASQKKKTSQKNKTTSKKDVFTLESVDEDKVVVKVNVKDPLTIANHPYLDASMSYITVTRGKNHILTLIRDNGSTWSFDWGTSGYTLISKNTKKLKTAIIDFIENKCHILLGYTGGTPSSCCIFYNANFNKWQLSMTFSFRHNYDVFKMSETAKSEKEMIKECEVFVKAGKWEKEIAPTGISIWVPKNPVYTLR